MQTYSYAQAILFFTLLWGSCVLAKIPDDTLVIAWRIDETTTFDPAEVFEFSGLEFVSNTYNKLVKADKHDPGKFSGEIAKSWHITDSGRTFQFNIKRGIQFNSGNRLTAEDVVYSLRRLIFLNKAPAFLLTQFGLTADNVLSNITAPEKYLLEIKTELPYAPTLLLNCLSTPNAAIVDSQLVKEHTSNNDWGNEWLKTHFAGSGPFVLKSWKPSESLVLDQNPHYWQKPPSIQRIVFRHVQEETTQQLLLRKGDVDIVKNVKPSSLSDLDRYQLISSTKDWLVYLGLNLQNPYLKNPEVRQAIKWLIDYKSLVAVLYKGEAIVHQTIIPRGMFASDHQTPYHLNIAKAKALLKSAGYEQGFKLTLDVKKRQLGELLQASFAKANIKLEILSGDSKQLLTKYRARNHDMIISLWSSDFHDPHANASTMALNLNNSDSAMYKTVAWRNNWFDPTINIFTQSALKERDSERRQQLYMKLQKRMLEHSPIIVIAQLKENVIAQKYIKGLTLGFDAGSTFYEDVHKAS